MSTKSIGKYHATLGANAQPLLNELKRAEAESRRSMGGLRGSISATMRNIQRDFTIPKIAKGVLSGFGIGGGIQLVSTAMDVFAEKWKESEQFAAKLEERAKSIAELMRDVSKGWAKINFDNKTPEQQRDSMNQDVAKLAGQREKAMEDRLSALRAFAWVEDYSKKNSAMQIQQFEGEDFKRGGIAIPKREFTDIMGARLDDAQKRFAEAEKKMQALVPGIVALNKELSGNAMDDWIKDLANLAREVNLGAGRSPAQVRGEIGDDDSAAGRDAVRQMIEEREKESMQTFERMERAGAIRVDDMTRRGMGTGADYRSVQEQTNNILAQILETIRTAKHTAMSNFIPRYSD